MFPFLVRRLLAGAPVFLLVIIGLFALVAATPVPTDLTEEQQERRYSHLPILFNAAPADRPRIIAETVARLRTEDGLQRANLVKLLLRIGAAGLTDIVAALEAITPVQRARVSRELAPLAYRMGLEEVADLDNPIKVDRFWHRALEDRGVDLRPSTLRRVLRRHLDDRAEPLYARQLANADTAALAPLLEALDGELTAGDREEIQALAVTAAIKAGAKEISDIATLRAFWTVHRAQYVEFDPVERVAAHLTETRFGRWVISIFTQRFGTSWRTDTEVLGDLRKTAPSTLRRMFFALIAAYLLGLPMGAIAARRRGKLADRAIGLGATFAYAVPSFVVVLFARSIVGMNGVMLEVTMTIGLTTALIAPIARHARSAALDVIRQDFVRVARGKGLSPLSIWFGHVGRSVAGPILALGTALAPIALANAMVAEVMLDLPGLGPAAIAAARARDLPWLMGFSMLTAFAVLLIAVVADVVHAALDPRVRISLTSPGAQEEL